ncbi:homer protein homolog 2-like [Bolinopsis microptera]|uniref:homer protein homolog 2-like n=1 Tax=Bolinopsis microptera TaxID=2820187 RepID=UPI00307A497F
MGDRPVYSCRCHVFRIDATTKKTWIPAAEGPVQVSFFFDPNKRGYRVVSIDNGKPIINSTIVAGMTFSRTAQKFGQWSDQRANTVYGVGFSNEDELAKFADQFEEAKSSVARDTLSPVGSPPPIENHETEPPPRRAMSPGLPPEPARSTNSFDMDIPVKLRSSVTTDGESSEHSRTSGQENGVENLVENLRLDNDRLKTSLSQSQNNLKKWEVELQTLRTNNSRLQGALHENSRNIEEWKTQLLQYREENSKLRSRNEELEIEIENLNRSGTHSPKLNKKITKSNLKSEEVERVKQILEKVTAELVEVKEENMRMKGQLRTQDDRNGQSKQAYENSMICQLQADMEIRLRDLVDMNRKLLTYCRKT